jgi:hypothetical protein
MSGVWPAREAEQVLAACFGREPAARQALDELADSGDAAALGPLLYRRWPAAKHRAVEEGRRAYLTLWRQNGERLEHLAAVLSRFGGRGIRCLVLKGAALAVRYYRDAGVRAMRDFDLLIRDCELETAIALLEEAGYRAEGGLSGSDIARRARVGHAWQFSLGDRQSCDLHWRPVVRCYSPEVERLFWEGAEKCSFGGAEAGVLGPTDQLFHVCAHGLQWDWHPQVRWVADALTVLREPVDWKRLKTLACEAWMRVRLARALRYLRDRWEAAVPEEMPAELERAAPEWETREYRLLLKACPLGFVDSALWHWYHFRRIRRFDQAWSEMPALAGFAEYVPEFVGARDVAALWNKLTPELRARL